MPIKIIYINSK